MLVERAEPPASSRVRGWREGEGDNAGARMEQGGGGAMQGLCGDFGDRGGCWHVAPPPTAQGFSLLQPLPGCIRWLRAIPAGPREISAGERGRGAGSGVWVRDQGRAGCLGAKFPFLGYSCSPHVTLGHGMHRAPAPTAALPAPGWCWGCRLGGFLPFSTQAILPAVAPCTTAPSAR